MSLHSQLRRSLYSAVAIGGILSAVAVHGEPFCLVRDAAVSEPEIKATSVESLDRQPGVAARVDWRSLLPAGVARRPG
jgi:hypothetical protein